MSRAPEPPSPETPPSSSATPPPTSFLGQLMQAQKRQAGAVVGDLVRMRGLMPLLMKNRNGGAWSPEEKAELLDPMRRLSRVSPVLLLLLLPGSAILLPIYAWWLDRRDRPRQERLPPP